MEDGPIPISTAMMSRALILAKRGCGWVEPNPMVGAVVVSAAGQVVGEGWHERYGGPHAEVRALQQARESARGGTLFVTLEPCCHWGKTPPCTDAILAAGIARVVAAMPDPFPKVAGGGIAVLRQAGVQVEVGMNEAQARELNAPYLKRISTGRPWVIAKWAMSLDGRIATTTGDSQWISNPESRARVHELRGRVDAIFVGRGTLLADNPRLTARPPGSRVATRVVVTASGDLPHSCQLLETASDFPTLVLTKPENVLRLQHWEEAGVEVLAIEGEDFVAGVLDLLGSRQMTNILVEGGAGLLGSFHDSNAIDEAWVFVAPLLIGGSKALSPLGGTGAMSLAEALRFPNVETQSFGRDVLIRCWRNAIRAE